MLNPINFFSRFMKSNNQREIDCIKKNQNYSWLIVNFQEKYLPYLYRNYFVKRSKLMIKLHKEILAYVFNPIRWSRKRGFELGFNLVDYESDDSDESNESGEESCSEPKHKKLKKVY